MNVVNWLLPLLPHSLRLSWCYQERLLGNHSVDIMHHPISLASILFAAKSKILGRYPRCLWEHERWSYFGNDIHSFGKYARALTVWCRCPPPLQPPLSGVLLSPVHSPQSRNSSALIRRCQLYIMSLWQLKRNICSSSTSSWASLCCVTVEGKYL